MNKNILIYGSPIENKFLVSENKWEYCYWGIKKGKRFIVKIHSEYSQLEILKEKGTDVYHADKREKLPQDIQWIIYRKPLPSFLFIGYDIIEREVLIEVITQIVEKDVNYVGLSSKIDKNAIDIYNYHDKIVTIKPNEIIWFI